MNRRSQWPAAPWRVVPCVVAMLAGWCLRDRPAAGEVQTARAATAAADLAAALGGPSAVAEQEALATLVRQGDAAVPALAAKVHDARSPRPGRILAAEALGHIATPAARAALVAALRDEKKDLALRAALATQCGLLMEPAAVGPLTQWLATLGPKALDDVPREGKEGQPSTVYIRHIEALAAIGDPAAIEAIEAFRSRVPAGIGFGGFVTNFLTGAADEAIEELRERAALGQALDKAGLAEAARAVFLHWRRDPLARLRMHEWHVVRRDAQGRAALADEPDGSPVKAHAAALLARWKDLGGQEGPS